MARRANLCHFILDLLNYI